MTTGHPAYLSSRELPPSAAIDSARKMLAICGLLATTAHRPGAIERLLLLLAHAARGSLPWLAPSPGLSARFEWNGKVVYLTVHGRTKLGSFDELVPAMALAVPLAEIRSVVRLLGQRIAPLRVHDTDHTLSLRT